MAKKALITGVAGQDGSYLAEFLIEKGYATEAEIETIDQRVKGLVDECEKFAEDSPYPETNVMYDVVYDQKNYPFLPHKL